MSADELRTDPFTWALAKHHVQVVAPRYERRRRLKLMIGLFVGALLATLASWFGVSSLSADSPAAVDYRPESGGSGLITVSDSASYREIIDELRVVLRDRGHDVGVETRLGGDVAVGRLQVEGEGLVVLDPDIDFDNTGTEVAMAADATGNIVVVAPTPQGAVQSIPGLGLRCEVVGMTIAEVRQLAAGLGLQFVVPSGFEFDETTRVVYAETSVTHLVAFVGEPPTLACGDE